VLASILNVEPLPEFGMSIAAPRLSTGTATLVQTGDNIAVQETDLVEANVSSPIVTISGQEDLSEQLWDRGEGLDVVLARDLGEDFASKLDVQIVSGIGSAGQFRGLLQIAGLTSVAKTNGSPTAVTNLAAIGDLVSQTATAYAAAIARPSALSSKRPNGGPATKLDSNKNGPPSSPSSTRRSSSERTSSDYRTHIQMARSGRPFSASVLALRLLVSYRPPSRTSTRRSSTSAR
jgi:Phage capsid family